MVARLRASRETSSGQRFWPDKTIANLKFQHQIEYDNLKRVYTIRLSERKNGVIEVKNFGTAKKLMSEVVALTFSSGLCPIFSFSVGF